MFLNSTAAVNARGYNCAFVFGCHGVPDRSDNALDVRQRSVFVRSEERRVGKECATLCRFRWRALKPKKKAIDISGFERGWVILERKVETELPIAEIA